MSPDAANQITPVARGPLSDSYWVESGRLLAGRHPGSGELSSTRTNLRRLLEAGISLCVDLTEPGEAGFAPYESTLQEEAMASGRTVAYLRAPILDFSVPSVAEMRTILSTLTDAIASGKNVYVHCWGGIGRTGTVIGCYLVERGLTGEQALDTIARLRSHVPSGHWPSPEAEPQVAMVLAWHPLGAEAPSA